jgi:uncharacterized protein (UPF0303 family)
MGFVMSGKRRKKKAAKQVDKSSRKAGLQQAKEEKELKESELVAKFKEMVQGYKDVGESN